MQSRSVRDLESSGSFLTRAGPVGRALDKVTSLVQRKPNYDASDTELLHLGNSSDEPDTSYAASGRINSLVRGASDSPVATDSSVQAVTQEPYDKDMKRKYAKHLKASERLFTQVLLTLRVEHPQKGLWVLVFLLMFGLSFMAQFLQSSPPSKVNRVARRSDNAEAAFAIYGWGLPIAKGAAQTIKVTAMVMLLPVARSFLTFLRRSSIINRAIPFDSNLKFHRFFGYTLFLFAWIHTGAHVANSINQTKASSNQDSTLCDSVDGIVQIPCSLYEKSDPSKFGHRNSFMDWWTSETSITGIIMLVILCIGYPCAVLRSSSIAKKVIKETSFIGKRLYSFTWFFFSHQFMTISFYVVLVLHPLPGLPGNPRPHASTSWVYVLIGVLAYVMDRTLRVYRQATWETTVVDARILPGEVLELKLLKPRNTNLWRAPGFSYVPGQYAFLNVPQISFAEWHPFTITSVPSDNFVMFHIKSAGDWTALLHGCISKQLATNAVGSTASPEMSTPPNYTDMERISEGQEMSMPSHTHQGSEEELVFANESDRFVGVMGWQKPVIHMDGLCGAPAQNYKDYKVLLLVGGNIGVTPFICILRKLLSNMERNRCSNCGVCNLKHIKHKHVYFFWTVRDEAAVQYFNSTFAGILDIRIHLTSRKPIAKGPDGSQVLEKSSSLQIPSDLGLTIYPGRPEWRAVFQTICVEHPRDTVGVFCCGPLGLTQDLKVLSREYSVSKGSAGNDGGPKPKGQATKFDFFQEHF